MSTIPNELVRQYYQDSERFTRRATQLAANTTIYKGHLAMYSAGSAVPLLSGSALQALCTTIAGADSNGNLVARACQPNVRLTLTGGTSTAFGVTVSYANAGYIDVLVQLATDSGSAVTTTAKGLANAIWAHAEASCLLKVNFTGTGASIAVATTATLIAQLYLLGLAVDTYINQTGSAIAVNMGFCLATIDCALSPTDAPSRTGVGAEVMLVDDTPIIAATIDPVSFTATLVDIDFNGMAFIKLHKGRD